MANTNPEDLAAAALAYERSNASLKDYDPTKQEALDERYEQTLLDTPARELPKEPITATADAALKVSDSKK